MRKRRYPKFIYFLHQIINPIFDPIKSLCSFPRYIGFIEDLIKYSRIEGREKINLLDICPCLHNKTKTQGFDSHYFYQDIWAFQKIYESKVSYHVDVGSRVDFIGFLTKITKVAFVDIRPLKANLENFESIKGNILSLPFRDNSIKSLSCLHVAEHIGLGRYGDSLDPFGTEKACKELSRVLAINGNLYFSLPVGKPRLCFNAQRIHTPKQILEYFNNLKLIEFSGINDEGVFKRNIAIKDLENADYACGLFWFKKLQ
jgi:hypothetical protein